MYRWIGYCLTLCQAAFLITCIDLDCIPNDKCSCKFTDGRGIVDITSLGRTDNKPRYCFNRTLVPYLQTIFENIVRESEIA